MYVEPYCRIHVSCRSSDDRANFSEVCQKLREHVSDALLADDVRFSHLLQLCTDTCQVALHTRIVINN